MPRISVSQLTGLQEKRVTQKAKNSKSQNEKKAPGQEPKNRVLVSYWYGIGTHEKEPLFFKGSTCGKQDLNLQVRTYT